VSNVPLFLLAAPMLCILIMSGIDIIAHVAATPEAPSRASSAIASTASSSSSVSSPSPSPQKQKKQQRFAVTSASDGVPPRMRTLVVSMALAQVTLAVLALTIYHVQIITRISSGYPVWYWWVARCLMDKDRKKVKMGEGIVIFMVMYAMIQGALFASFLPPA
jgi:GPI mannosyltransferase 2